MRWFEQINKQTLGHWPTPLEPLNRLSEELGGPQIWLKRDDCSGLLTGGNKTRKLEYLIADALAEHADTIVTFGAIQSNHARQTAAACAKLGLECHLVLTRRVNWTSQNYETNGNLILNEICGAHIHIMNSEDAEKETKKLIEGLKSDNKSVYVIPPGGSNATGALGYVSCAKELTEQLESKHLTNPILVHASASAGTQSGLIFGFQCLGKDIETLGINVYHDDQENLIRRIQTVLSELCDTYHESNIARIPEALIRIDHGYLGQGYGIPSRKTIEAIQLAASLEGIAFDPVYSGKALEALIDKTILGDFDDYSDVILVHTGGAFALPVYQEALTNR